MSRKQKKKGAKKKPMKNKKWEEKKNGDERPETAKVRTRCQGIKPQQIDAVKLQVLHQVRELHQIYI